jgi:hypothetical protein
MVKLRCIRNADILKRAYLCQVSGTGSPEPLVFSCLTIEILQMIADLIILEYEQ